MNPSYPTEELLEQARQRLVAHKEKLMRRWRWCRHLRRDPERDTVNYWLVVIESDLSMLALWVPEEPDDDNVKPLLLSDSFATVLRKEVDLQKMLKRMRNCPF